MKTLRPAPRPTSPSKPTQARKKVPRKLKASKAKAETKTRKAKPRGQIDDADIKIIRFKIPEIEGWPTMLQALGMRPGGVRLLTRLKPANPLLMNDTGRNMPISIRAAYNLTMNFERACDDQYDKYMQMAVAKLAFESAGTGSSCAIDDAELGRWDEDIEKGWAITMLLAGICEGCQAILAPMIREALSGMTGRSPLVVVRGYRIMSCDLSPKVPWRHRVPADYRPAVAFALFTKNVHPLRMPPGLLDHILDQIRELRSHARKRATKKKKRA